MSTASPTQPRATSSSPALPKPSQRAQALAKSLIATLPTGVAGLFNPWAEQCQHETPNNAALQRQERLARHLDCEPVALLVGEAPGYQGCRYSGVSFTSEAQLIRGSIPRMTPLAPKERLSLRHRPFSEPSATIVWRTLEALRLEHRTVLWNAVQMHPHKLNQPWTNRTPTAAEIAIGIPALCLLCKAFPGVQIVAVGKKAKGILEDAGINYLDAVRHPANGGATQFFNDVKRLAPQILARPKRRP